MQYRTTYWLSRFPVTKLRPPDTHEIITRRWLTATLHQLALSHRVTLISAPAGSGKTTLAAELSSGTGDFDMRWLSLDEGDNNLQAFLLMLVVVLLRDENHELLHNINTGHLQARQVANILVNWLDESMQQPLVLVLDDLHLLTDQASHEFLDYLIERLPVHVHILLITRYDPPLSLAKLRSRGDLAEVRLDRLRFSPDEAGDYLNRLLNLNLSDELITHLCQRTEGWIAGLRLLALSLVNIDADKRAVYIDRLAQNDRYVFELLAEEVLAQQTDDVRRFLLETSILAELTPDLCRVVTGQANAAHILHQLHQRNLFLVALGDGAYRYHALFRDFLRDQLKNEHGDLYKEMHMRAAAAHRETVYAFQHYVAAEAWDDAIAVMRAGLTHDVVNCIVTLVDTRLELFVNQLPQHLQDYNPWVLLVRGCLAVDRGLYQTGIPLMEAARRLFEQTGEVEGELLTDIQLLTPQLERTDNGDTYPLFCERVRSFVDVITPEVQFVILIAGIWNSAWNYRHEKVERYLLEMIDELIQQDSADTYRKFAQTIGHVLFFTSQGMLPFDRVLPHLQRHASRDSSLTRMGVCNIQSLLALLRGDMDSARRFAQESQHIIGLYGGFAWAEGVVDSVMTGAAFASEDFAAFDAYYHARIPEIMRFDTLRHYMTEHMYLYGRRLLAENRVEEARQVCQEMRGNYAFKEYEGLLYALQAHIALHTGSLHEAERLMRQAVDIRAATNRFFPTNGRLGLALIYWRMGERDLALDTLREGLSPLASWGMPGLVLMEGRELLPLLEAGAEAGIYPDMLHWCITKLRGDAAHSRPVSLPDGSEVLTPREADILRLIVDGASNRAIADALVITENTVKSHITRILGKLNAKSRTEAAARVRELHLSL